MANLVGLSRAGCEPCSFRKERAWNANCVQTQSGGAGDGNRTRTSAWEADVLPLNYAAAGIYYDTKLPCKNQVENRCFTENSKIVLSFRGRTDESSGVFQPVQLPALAVVSSISSESAPSVCSTSSLNARAEMRRAPCPRMTICSSPSEVATRTRCFRPIS